MSQMPRASGPIDEVLNVLLGLDTSQLAQVLNVLLGLDVSQAGLLAERLPGRLVSILSGSSGKPTSAGSTSSGSPHSGSAAGHMDGTPDEVRTDSVLGSALEGPPSAVAMQAAAVRAEAAAVAAATAVAVAAAEVAATAQAEVESVTAVAAVAVSDRTAQISVAAL